MEYFRIKKLDHSRCPIPGDFAAFLFGIWKMIEGFFFFAISMTTVVFLVMVITDGSIDKEIIYSILATLSVALNWLFFQYRLFED